MPSQRKRTATAAAIPDDPAKRQQPRIDERYACFHLILAKSKIHRWGLYAGERIPPRRKIIEYTGQKINRRETKLRDQRKLHYLFTLNSYWTIDGAVGGSGAEYINHSCEPNVRATILKGHILYFSLREIKKGEELTIDYNFAKDVETVPCKCGTPKCRGTINLKE